jgi:thioredoxin reductase (NADPH)
MIYNHSMYDLIIIGSGPSGLTAAIYTTRANIKTLIIAGITWGGQLQLTTDVENFPGFPEGIQGPELMTQIRKQAERFGAEIIDANADPVDFTKQRDDGLFEVTANGISYLGKTVLVATGADAKMLGVPGEKELTGRGVSYCATCDGAFFRNKHIIVVGGGDSAMEEAHFLTHFASKVTMIHRRDSFRASQIMIERVRSNPKIEIILNSQITRINGTQKVESVELQTLQSDGASSMQTMPIDGIFIAIGHTPNTKLFTGLTLREGGYVDQGFASSTNVPGVFVSGDVTDNRYRQAITAAGFGAQAALDIERYLAEQK